MAFIAEQYVEKDLWEYILGSDFKKKSIAEKRYEFLLFLGDEHGLKLSLRDHIENKWTKWEKFPGLLWISKLNSYGSLDYSYLTAAIDVHRSMLKNEIIIESDYPRYQENYEASRIVGKIIEDKGFKPLYYYSGNKSIHIHVFFDWDCLKEVDLLIQDKLRVKYLGSITRFRTAFIRWLRKKMISCWDTRVREFDKDLITASHLIRCELSKNKKGFKTFLGNSHKDLSPIPFVCNEKNGIYPSLGEMESSRPNDVAELVDEFVLDFEIKTKRDREARRNKTLGSWFGEQKDIRNCVRAILNNDFKEVNDGFKRAFFILFNELRVVHGDSKARELIEDWNVRMGNPINEGDITIRLNSKKYTLSCKYIHSFLDELGIKVGEKCYGKV